MQIDLPEPVFKPGHHSPPHLFVADSLYMLTGSTYSQQPLIRTDDRKRELLDAIQYAADIYLWKIIAWVIMDNHYHLILNSPVKVPVNLPKFVTSYHRFTARFWNMQEHVSGRMVWFNYWDTCIRSEDDFLNRLRYVFWNPVKHRLVHEPEEYAYCNFNDFLDKEWFDIGQTPVEVKDVPEF
jgi:putative transposase